MSKPSQLSRRQFIGKSAVAGVAVPLFVSSRVLAQPGKPGANDRIQLGLIGAGGMGRGNLAELREVRRRRGHRHL